MREAFSSSYTFSSSATLPLYPSTWWIYGTFLLSFPVRICFFNFCLASLTVLISRSIIPWKRLVVIVLPIYFSKYIPIFFNFLASFIKSYPSVFKPLSLCANNAHVLVSFLPISFFFSSALYSYKICISLGGWFFWYFSFFTDQEIKIQAPQDFFLPVEYHIFYFSMFYVSYFQ